MIHYHWGNRVFHSPPEVLWRWLIISTIVLVLALVWYLLELIVSAPSPLNIAPVAASALDVLCKI